VYLIINSNPWFSAVSDYSLQMCLYLKKNNTPILYCAHIDHTQMDVKCKEHSIPFFNMPIHHQNLFDFFKSFFLVTSLLFQNRKKLKYIIVFEGREHTLLALTKLCFPFLWKGKTLMRVRGQAQIVKSNLFSKMIYNYLTDRVIFAATCVKERMEFQVPEHKYKIQLYGKDYLDPAIKSRDDKGKSRDDKVKSRDDRIPWNDNNMTFLLLGRFDPVKGHDCLLQAYLKAKLSCSTNLVFIGKSENLKASDMREQYLPLFKKESNSDHKNLHIIDEQIPNLQSLLQHVHFGVIPSLDSEVICRVGVEFLQSGIPVLYSNAGALPEVFCDFSEFMFEKNNIEELTLKLEMACSIFSDKSKFSELKKQAQTIGLQKYNGNVYSNLFDHF
jgi:glycosyltransferase involved in cell wall biosynthesis